MGDLERAHLPNTRRETLRDVERVLHKKDCKSSEGYRLLDKNDSGTEDRKILEKKKFDERRYIRTINYFNVSRDCSLEFKGHKQ